MNRKKTEAIQSLISALSLIIALISVFIAFQANQKAEMANLIAEDANKISRDMNKIELLNSKSIIAAYMGPNSVMINSWGCNIEGARNRFGLFSGTDFSITLANVGARPVSLVQIKLINEVQNYWNIKIFVNGEEKLLPVTFEQGYKKEWHIVATNWKGFDTEAENLEALRKIDIVIPITLSLEFDDGNIVKWEGPSWVSSPDHLIFETSCEQTENNWFNTFGN